MRTHPLRRALALIAALTLFAMACGDDDSGAGGSGSGEVSAEARPYVDAVKASILESGDGDLYSEDQIDCVAPAMVETLDVDRLTDAGITPADLKASGDDLDFSDVELSEDEGNALFDSFGDCGIDLQATMFEEMEADEDLSEAARACMEAALTEENLRTFFVTAMVEGNEALEEDPAVAPIVAQIMGCAFMGMDDAPDGAAG